MRSPTGAFKNSALVAVSTGLLQSMKQEEVEAGARHEIAHVANGDHGHADADPGRGEHVRRVLRADHRLRSSTRRVPHRARQRPGYFITVIVAQIVLGILASMIVAWFSRLREFRADAGSANTSARPRRW
jgi:heat shock protein HtpX